MDKRRLELFENQKISKAVATLSIPTVLSTLVMVLYNIADTYFVGLLNNPVESAAVTLAAPVLLAFNAINNLFAVGTSSMMSRSLGKKDYDTVKKCASFGFYSAAISALLISVLYTFLKLPVLNLLGADKTTAEATANYLFWTVTCGAAPAILNVVLSSMVRSEGSSMHASVGVISGCVLNVILDPFFVLPKFLNMGASGAGFATFISNTVACLYFFVLLFIQRKKTYVCLNPKQFTLRKDIFKEVFGVGIPSSIQNLLNVTGSIILNNFTAEFGANAVSAMGIAHKVNLIPMYICMGISQGVMPLVGYNYASGNRKRMKDAIIFVAKIGLVIALASTVLMYIFAGDLIRAFMDNDQIVEYGTILLRGMCIGITFLALDFLAVGVFQAIGKGKYSLIFAIMRKIVLEIPAIIILNHFFPLYGMGYAATCAEFVLAIAAAVLLKKIFDNKENHKLADGN